MRERYHRLKIIWTCLCFTCPIAHSYLRLVQQGRAESSFSRIRRDLARLLSNPLHPPKNIAYLLIFFILDSQILLAKTYLIFSDSSQKDTSQTHDKTPSRAALLSTCLPGLGQAYNKKYWKIPIVYGFIGSLSYFAWNNHQNYLIFRDALRSRYDNDPNTTDNFPNINDQVLKAQREYYRRNRDMFIIFSFLAYGLNILDAYVDAHLKGFTVSDKLSLKPIPHFNHFQIALTWKIN